MNRTEIEARYFEWMYDLVCGYSDRSVVSYRELLWYLNDVEFLYYIRDDYNRASDGMDLRRRFAYDFIDVDHAEDYILGPCTVLEMMIALALRCEEIMDDPDYGDRTSQWFWKMIVNLGLGGMNDEHFDVYLVDDVITNFLDRTYEPDGRGGLFVIRNCTRDLRDASIWQQMIWFIDSNYV